MSDPEEMQAEDLERSALSDSPEQPTDVAGSEPAAAAAPESAPGTASPEATGTPGSEPKAGVEHQKLRQRAQSAEAEAAYWRGVAQGRTPSREQPEQHAQPQGPPKVDDFQSYDDFIVARAMYDMRQEQAAFEQQRAAVQAHQQFQARLAEASKADPDVGRLASDPTLPVSPAMAQMLQQSEAPGDLLRYLDDHRDEAQRLFYLNPLLVARELGKIESRLTAKPEPQKRVSAAPEPVKPVSGRGAPDVDEDALSDDEWLARQRSRAGR